MISVTYDNADWASDIGEGGAVAAPILVTLLEGQVIHARLDGHGTQAEFPNEQTGEVDKVNTWVFSSLTSSVRISILSSTQLDKKLEEWIGCVVKVRRNAEVKRKGKPGYYTDYAVKGYPATRVAVRGALPASTGR